MSLIADIRPGEIMLINGAQLRVSRRVSWVVDTPESRVLFGRMVIDADHLSTPLLKLYFAIQQAYAGTGGEEREKWERELPLYIHEVKTYIDDAHDTPLIHSAPPGVGKDAEVLREVEKHLEAKQMYKALRCIFLRYQETDEFPSVR